MGVGGEQTAAKRAAVQFKPVTSCHLDVLYAAFSYCELVVINIFWNVSVLLWPLILEIVTVPAQVSRQHKLLQTSNWINLWFCSSWEVVVFVHTSATVTCMWNCTCPGCRTASGSCAVGQGGGGACIAISDGILWLSFPTQAEGKAVLITGCDKGFGHALAKCLHAKGFTVFAGCLLMVSGEIDQNFSD